MNIRLYIVLLSSLTAYALHAAPGCESDSYHCEEQENGKTKYDDKSRHPVVCTCPCGTPGSIVPRTILPNGKCVKCRHYRSPSTYYAASQYEPRIKLFFPYETVQTKK